MDTTLLVFLQIGILCECVKVVCYRSLNRTLKLQFFLSPSLTEIRVLMRTLTHTHTCTHTLS